MEKEMAREATRRLVTASLKPLVQSAIMHARGIGHVYTRDKNGKFTRVENQDRIDQLLCEGTENADFFIFSKDPSTQAFKDLLDRALDKPKEQAQEIHVTGEIELSSRLTSARKRVIDVTISPLKKQIADAAAEGT
jgi:hypothetical protein